MADVLAVGEAMAMLCPDPPAPLRQAVTLTLSVAGAEANVAVHLAALGLRTVFVSRVGDDPFGERIGDRLRAAGVDALLATHPAAPTGVYFKDPAATGTRVHYYRAGSAAASMDASVWATCPPARLVHLSGVTPALSPSCARLVWNALTHRPIAGATMSFDVNFRPALWAPTKAGPVLAALANRADIVFVGLDEAATLWGTTDAAQVRAVLDRPGLLIVKDGGVGATAFAANAAGSANVAADMVTFQPAGPIEILEPVGAGDAFAAGYLFGVLTGRSPREQLRLGHHLAGVALRTVADVGDPPTTADLLTATADREDDDEF